MKLLHDQFKNGVCTSRGRGCTLTIDMCCLCVFSCYGIALRKQHMAVHDVLDVLDVLDETLEDAEW